MIDTNDTFVCAQCGETFDKIISDKDAFTEAEKDGWLDCGGPISTVCDGCYADLKAWWTPERLASLHADRPHPPQRIH